VVPSWGCHRWPRCRQGTPALTAQALRAVVQANGHTVWIEKSSDTEAVARGRRKGEDVTHESRWTIKRAERLGLTNKDNWRKQPEAMLIARATSEICRLVASDAILGVGYSVEELTDDAPAAPPKTVRRTVNAEGPPAIEAAEPTPVEVVAEVLGGEVIEPDAPADVMTQPQRAALHVAFKEAGITDRTKRLAYASEVVGRTLATSAELTKAEASDVIDALKREAKND
jgi:hypothetical protein